MFHQKSSRSKTDLSTVSQSCQIAQPNVHMYLNFYVTFTSSSPPVNFNAIFFSQIHDFLLENNRMPYNMARAEY